MIALSRANDNTPLQAKLNWLAKLAASRGSSSLSRSSSASSCSSGRDPGADGEPKGVGVRADPDHLGDADRRGTAGVSAARGDAGAGVCDERMTKENLLVRVLGSCETMANASVVCTDKMGTLTMNEMSVGIHAKFVRRLKENEGRANVGEEAGLSREKMEEGRMRRKHPDDFAIDQSELGVCMGRALEGVFQTRRSR